MSVQVDSRNAETPAPPSPRARLEAAFVRALSDEINRSTKDNSVIAILHTQLLEEERRLARTLEDANSAIQRKPFAFGQNTKR